MKPILECWLIQLPRENWRCMVTDWCVRQQVEKTGVGVGVRLIDPQADLQADRTMEEEARGNREGTSKVSSKVKARIKGDQTTVVKGKTKDGRWCRSAYKVFSTGEFQANYPG